MKRFRLFLASVGQPLLVYTLLSVALVGLLTFRLGTLVPLSTQEVAAVSSVRGFRDIANNPLNGAHKLAQTTAKKLDHFGPFAMRLPSAVFGFLAVVLFFLTVRHWFTIRISIISSILFATSSWFLYASRSATAAVLFTLLPVLMLCGLWIRNSRNRNLAIFVSGMAAAALLYIPGLVWFLIPAVIWQRHLLIEELKHASKLVVFATFVVILCILLPLGWAVSQNIHILREFAAIPASLPSITTAAANILNIPLQLFLRGPDRPDIWLGRLAILDIFSIGMFVYGAYALYLRRKIDRIKAFAGIFLVIAAMAALGNEYVLLLSLPFVYMIIGNGMSLLLQQWLTVFPRNPLARTIGITFLVTGVALSSFYNLNRYFVAWPNAPATKQIYQQESLG